MDKPVDLPDLISRAEAAFRQEAEHHSLLTFAFPAKVDEPSGPAELLTGAPGERLLALADELGAAARAIREPTGWLMTRDDDVVFTRRPNEALAAQRAGCTLIPLFTLRPA